ncbi:hypothetical protein NLJ89_g9114 [Agrocybe chaxingu]|uniref:DUF3752 domain-containing protein n=1 Tax=Agrocybe chaxingu TaxID=84603 RepID=A0A9W8MS50_9AGAR|nr:hypothetical protein NLJ89_g9114 [Agrocybe chaxingu]
MAPIGPQIPEHLLKQLNPQSSDKSDGEDAPGLSTIGPQIPKHLQPKREAEVRVYDEDEDESPRPSAGPSIGPAIPPELLGSSKRVEDEEDWGIGPFIPGHLRPSTRSPRPIAGPSMPSQGIQSKRTIGPSLPPGMGARRADYDDDSDDDVGPMPLPAGVQYVQKNPVQEFMEREEKMRKAAEAPSKPKAPKRDEWMLVPPTNSGLLGNLDPTKLKARQFSRSAHDSSSSKSRNEPSLWTETPAERLQRLSDEVSGKKRRVTDAPAAEDEDEKSRKRRRRQEEEKIRKGVDDYTRAKRGPALVDQHASKVDTSEKKEPPAIWDHSRDMGLGGRLMDEDKRNKMLREAKGLGDRFGSGKSGGFL